MRVFMSVGGPSVFDTAEPSNEILIATSNGVAWLTRGRPGDQWRETRRALEGKHVSSLAEDPASGRIFAGTASDGVYVSDDDGANWECKNRGLEFLNVYTLNLVQAGGDVRVYAGTGPAHLYLSEDLGESWTELTALRDVPSVENWSFPAPPHIGHVKYINFDPRSADTIYAAVEVGGLFKSEDAGQTWQELQGIYEDVHRVIITAAQPADLHVATGGGLYHSPDSGNTWEQLTDRSARIAYPDALVLHPRQPRLAFMAGAISSPRDWLQRGTADPRIARSRDGGRTWQYLQGGLPDHFVGNIEGLTLNSWSGGSQLFAGTLDGDVFWSGDEGETWERIAQEMGVVGKIDHAHRRPRGGAPATAGSH
jgi:photosystem II stability/assembly factor-like uncharacterized protein